MLWQKIQAAVRGLSACPINSLGPNERMPVYLPTGYLNTLCTCSQCTCTCTMHMTKVHRAAEKWITLESLSDVLGDWLWREAWREGWDCDWDWECQHNTSQTSHQCNDNVVFCIRSHHLAECLVLSVTSSFPQEMYLRIKCFTHPIFAWQTAMTCITLKNNNYESNRFVLVYMVAYCFYLLYCSRNKSTSYIAWGHVPVITIQT